MLTARVTRMGNSRGVVIPKAVIELLGWSIGTEVELLLAANGIVLSVLPMEKLKIKRKKLK